MYEKLEVCPICKNTQYTNHIICTDHVVSGESFALSKCTKCTLVFTNPRPDSSTLGKYYESESYISHSNKSNSLTHFIYKTVRKYTLRQKVQLIKKYRKKKGTLLDYGCGTGEFLLTASKKDWKTLGYEPNSKARQQATQKGIVLLDDLKSMKDKVDVITAWHVIEHVSELKKTVKSLKKKMVKGGLLFIAVPNINSYDASHYKEYWAAYDVPRHLYHFSQQSIGQLFAKTKLTLIDTLPMKFDSYYVSMLSEKYQHDKTNYVKAIQTGRKSNRLAKTSGEYSSLIYVLKK